MPISSTSTSLAASSYEWLKASSCASAVVDVVVVDSPVAAFASFESVSFGCCVAADAVAVLHVAVAKAVAVAAVF